MKKKLFAVMLCFVMLCACAAIAEGCALCGGDRVCDTCQGRGYLEVDAYGAGGKVKIACLAGCEDGFCPDCVIACDICGDDGLCDVCGGL